MVYFNSETLIGQSIRKCLRHFNSYDLSHIPDELRYLEADGTILLLFSNEHVVKFIANTEFFSIKIESQIHSDLTNYKDISQNKFWQQRIGKAIQKIEFLHDKLEQPYGLKFYLENNHNFTIQYVSESDYEFDAIVIRNA